jgi:hypothetical protein
VNRRSNSADTVALATEAGVPYTQMITDDPIGDWTALMDVVEALCPRGSEREPSIGGRFEL